MRKRLRKKRRLGEFAEFGFSISFEMDDAIGNEERNKLLDRWIEAIESAGLQFGGGGAGTTWRGFVASDAPRGSATEAHRSIIRSWCQEESLVTSFHIGPVEDAWHGPYVHHE